MRIKAKFSFFLKPIEFIKYLRNKGLKLSFDYKEIMHEAHHHSFTVAKVMKEDLLLDIHSSLNEALENGDTFKTWKKNIKPTLKAHGWYGEVEVTDPKTGNIKNIHVGSRRLKTIYGTNMRVAYNVGRSKQMSMLPLSKYWRYNSALLSTSRDTHKSKHGIIKHRDDPWWVRNYPPNDWNCKCFVTAHSKKSMEKNGWRETKSPIENIADEDWDYDVRKGAKLGKLSKMNLDDSLDELKDSSKVKVPTYKNLTDKKLLNLFFKTLGVKKGEVFIDKINNAIPTDDSYFKSFTGASKITKRDRSLYIKEIAYTLKDPDEIILEIETPSDDGKRKRSRAVKKYFRYLKTDNDAVRAVMVIVEILEDKTTGITGYFVSGDLVKKREGKLIYSKIKRVQ